jgi:hypothetical protein
MTKAKRKVLKVRDSTNAIMTATGLVKDNFLVGFELTISLWEENLGVLNNQFNKWLSLQRDYINLMKDVSEKFPDDGMKMWSESFNPLISSPTDWFTSLQRNYLRSAQNASGKFTKDVLNLSQKNIERVSSAFSDYLSLLGR